MCDKITISLSQIDNFIHIKHILLIKDPEAEDIDIMASGGISGGAFSQSRQAVINISAKLEGNEDYP